MRFYGLPTGYEFGSLVEAILDVSRGASLPLRRDARGASRRSTRTCACASSPRPLDPIAPGRSAWPSSSRSRARASASDAIEVTGYPELARAVPRSAAVPKTVVGDDGVEFVGAGPEAMLLQHVQEAAAARVPTPVVA